MWPVYGLLCEQLTLLKWPARAVDHWWHHAHRPHPNGVYGSDHGNGKRYYRTVWLMAKNSVWRQPANLWAGGITKEEEEEENSDVNDGSMRSNNCNIRTEKYLDTASVAGYTEQEFFQNFRMSRNTFHHICQRLSPRLLRVDVSFRRSISLRKRVGVGLYWVATGAGYRTLADLFGIAKSSVCAIVAPAYPRHTFSFFQWTLFVIHFQKSAALVRMTSKSH